jgi:type I restriction enzyme M protein
LNVSLLEGWLWEAACTIRGEVDAARFKDYILPLIFLKRISDVFDDEVNSLIEKYGDEEAVREMVESDHATVRFYVPTVARWPEIRKQSAVGVGQYLTDAVRAVSKQNPQLQGIVDVQDFNAQAGGLPLVGEGSLAAVIQILSRYRLGLDDVEPDILGRAYEYLLRKFAEGSGQTAGEFYTPREVGVMMARLLAPEPGMTVYDPCAGSSGLLIKCHLRLLELYGDQTNRGKLPADVAPLKLYGQEINHSTYAMSGMNAFIHEMSAELALGDSMLNPAYTDNGTLKKFDLVCANPMWNQPFPTSTYENDPYERFSWGIPTASRGDWGRLQHMLASLKPGGRMAVVLDTGAVSRGSGDTGMDRERDIRKAFVDGTLSAGGDLIEAVILLPLNLFYNTNAAGIIAVLNRAKKHPGEVLLINASKSFVKNGKNNFLTSEGADQVVSLYESWAEEEGISAVVTNAEIAANDYNLSPSRYIAGAEQEEVVPPEEAVKLLEEAEIERIAADRRLAGVLESLGLGGESGGAVSTMRP